jgi:hypothetical protein
MTAYRALMHPRVLLAAILVILESLQVRDASRLQDIMTTEQILVLQSLALPLVQLAKVLEQTVYLVQQEII